MSVYEAIEGCSHCDGGIPRTRKQTRKEKVYADLFCEYGRTVEIIKSEMRESGFKAMDNHEERLSTLGYLMDAVRAYDE